MNFISKLNIKGKLYGAFGVGILASLIVAIIAILAISVSLNVESKLKKLNADIEQTITVSTAYNKVHKWLHDLQVDPNPNLVAMGKGLANDLQSLSGKIPNAHFPQLSSDTSAAINNLVRSMNGEFFEALDRGDYKLADRIFLQKVLPYSSSTNSLFAQIIKSYNEELGRTIVRLDLRAPLYIIVIATIIGTLITLFFAFAIAKYIVHHTLRIKTIANHIEEGDFTFDTDHDVPADEIGDIYRSFHSIMDTLSRTVSRVISVSRDIEKISQDMISAATSIADGAHMAENQSITVAAASDEMVATTTDIAKNCHIAQETSEVTRAETNQGVEKVRLTVARIKEQSIQNQYDADKVLQLAEQSQKIGSIVGTIDEIAAQTNLLALNAAIEAARAGEAGRGFAVVADEVRALASRTSKSTQEITAMVRSVQEDSQAATDSMKNSVQQMEEMASRAGELEDTLNNIMSSVNNVNSQIIHISTAAEEQTTATSEISSNMQGITELAQQSSDVSQAQLSHAQQSSELVNTLLNELDFFKVKG